MPSGMKKLVAVIDDRTTDVCRAADGQVVPWGQPFVTLLGEFQTPPFHWNCRSVIETAADPVVLDHLEAFLDLDSMAEWLVPDELSLVSLSSTRQMTPELIQQLQAMGYRFRFGDASIAVRDVRAAEAAHQMGLMSKIPGAFDKTPILEVRAARVLDVSEKAANEIRSWGAKVVSTQQDWMLIDPDSPLATLASNVLKRSKGQPMTVVDSMVEFEQMVASGRIVLGGNKGMAATFEPGLVPSSNLLGLMEDAGYRLTSGFTVATEKELMELIVSGNVQIGMTEAGAVVDAGGGFRLVETLKAELAEKYGKTVVLNESGLGASYADLRVGKEAHKLGMTKTELQIQKLVEEHAGLDFRAEVAEWQRKVETLKDPTTAGVGSPVYERLVEAVGSYTTAGSATVAPRGTLELLLRQAALNAESSPVPLYRGMRFRDADEFLKWAERKPGDVIEQVNVSSFTSDQSVAQYFAGQTFSDAGKLVGGGRNSVYLVAEKGDVRGLRVQKISAHGDEAETIVAQNLVVKRVEAHDGYVNVFVEGLEAA